MGKQTEAQRRSLDSRWRDRGGLEEDEEDDGEDDEEDEGPSRSSSITVS